MANFLPQIFGNTFSNWFERPALHTVDLGQPSILSIPCARSSEPGVISQHHPVYPQIKASTQTTTNTNTNQKIKAALKRFCTYIPISKAWQAEILLAKISRCDQETLEVPIAPFGPRSQTWPGYRSLILCLCQSRSYIWSYFSLPRIYLKYFILFI